MKGHSYRSTVMDRRYYNIQRHMYYFLTCCNICCRFIYGCLNIKTIFKYVQRHCQCLSFKKVIVLLFLTIGFVQSLIIINFNYKTFTTPTPPMLILNKSAIYSLQINKTLKNKNDYLVLKIPSEAEFRMNLVKRKLNQMTKLSEHWEIMKLLNDVTPFVHTNRRVHIFYYTSYRNIEMDGEWKGWNQGYVLKTESEYSHINLTSTRTPPADISSNYYPLLGCYSLRDSFVLKTHMKQMRDAGIGVVVASWYPNKAKNSEDDIFALLLDAAREFQLQIAPHIETYTNVDNVLRNIHYITSKYTTHPAFYKLEKNGKKLPVYYVYESYLIQSSVWKNILGNSGSQSVRGTQYDGIFIGLMRHKHDRQEIEKSNFDGFYTYYPSNGLYYGSTWKNWDSLEKFAKKHKLLFFPSVSPGYIDTNTRPWNTALTRHRSQGSYYQVAWRSAIAIKSFGVSITSFNKWQEGSQIEPAKSKVQSHIKYLDYEPNGPLFYLNLTRYWVKQFSLQNNDYKFK